VEYTWQVEIDVYEQGCAEVLPEEGVREVDGGGISRDEGAEDAGRKDDDEAGSRV
jgi:hypothetical protein